MSGASLPHEQHLSGLNLPARFEPGEVYPRSGGIPRIVRTVPDNRMGAGCLCFGEKLPHLLTGDVVDRECGESGLGEGKGDGGRGVERVGVI